MLAMSCVRFYLQKNLKCHLQDAQHIVSRTAVLTESMPLERLVLHKIL